MKKTKTKSNREEARELHLNAGLTVEELASRYGKSVRTIYRWLSDCTQKKSPQQPNHIRKNARVRKFPPEIFNQITELKKELPQRSASVIRRLILKRFPNNTPSLSSIRDFIRTNGLTYKGKERTKGYVKFERSRANDLWQIDIAGVQTVAHLGKVYLIAVLDDHSRFILSAEYFKDQKGKNVLKIIRDAVLTHGRPNQILADNGTQFKNLIGELGTKYTRMLEFLGIKPIFAKPKHPQTKGKLERWFGTVKQMFLGEVRHVAECNPDLTLAEFNFALQEWLEWYNTKKPHRSLPENQPPINRFLKSEDRVFRPLMTTVNWDRWLQETERRKVTKYNEISYKSQKYQVPPGFMGSWIEVIEFEDKIELYFRDALITTHSYNVPTKFEKILRKIARSGTIMYKGKHYTIDYKLAGKTVEVQEINAGKNLLVYLDKTLLKTLKL